MDKNVAYKTNAQLRTSTASIFTVNANYAELIRTQSYIGSQGYTIMKANLQPDDLKQIILDLTIYPKAGFVVGKKTDPPVKAYRENVKKIYLPRSYGVCRYGMPMNKISPGDRIKLECIITLFGYQKEIVDFVVDYLNKPDSIGGLLEIPCGKGKTILSIALAILWGYKCFIFVHKEFLRDQWAENIKICSPNARIGLVQGKVFDIENKDFVIGMVQSMYNTDYPLGTFDSFGLTILDEVHRYGSGKFCKVLGKVQTRHIIGISATAIRGNGMTDLISKYVGPFIYTSERDTNEDNVTIYGAEYHHDSEKYTKVEYDFRNNIQYSKLITQISSFDPRINFVVQVILNCQIEFPDKQIIILASTRGLLTALHTKLTREFKERNKDLINGRVYRNTAGFYIGGSKPAVLKSTEQCQIILATYSMAAEALNIPTLDGLIFASPMTNIVQSIGRILRKPGKKFVFDIIDSHDTCINQFKKRRTYFKKCEYTILTAAYREVANVITDLQWKVWYSKLSGKKRKERDDSSDDDDDNDNDDDNNGNNNKKGCFIYEEED